MHHVAKFFKLDLPVVILVDLVEQVAQNLVIFVPDAESAFDLRVRDRATPIFVEQVERRFQLLLTY